MFKIAICDDIKTSIGNLEGLLKMYFKEKDLDVEILYFPTPSSLYNSMTESDINIIFMDLDFGNEEEDGILWATRIHNDFPKSLVIILTVHDNQYKEGYVAKAFRFMTKPFTTVELQKNLDDCLEELHLYQSINISRGGNTITIPIRDILYLEAYSGGSWLKTINTSYFCDESLLQWEGRLSPNIFFRCHKKYLINLNAIAQVKNHTVFLTNGEKLMVSRRKWTALKSAYIKFDIGMKGRTS